MTQPPPQANVTSAERIAELKEKIEHTPFNGEWASMMCELRALLESELAVALAELRQSCKEHEQASHCLEVFGRERDALSAELATRTAERDEALKALEPFARDAEYYEGTPDTSGIISPCIKLADLRNAARILAKHHK